MSSIESAVVSEYKLNEIMTQYAEKSGINLVKSRDGTVYKLKRDELDYSIVTLENGLRIFFIEDDLSVDSKVSMSVSAGHNQNPDEYPGLAHFLEHMLFIGSKKYPDPDLYSRLVSDAHGSANAYTADDHTLYYFDCSSNAIFDILDVFCNFFIEPLLDPKYVDKEITAVDYEHQKNIGSDNFRRWSLIDAFVTDRINSRFRTGDKTTLKKEGVLAALKQFYESYYTVDRMLAVVMHNNVDKEFIKKVSALFGAIPNRKGADQSKEIYPVGIRNVKGYEIIRAQRTTDGHEMMVRFFLSETVKNRMIIDKGYHILSYILNHRGERSLFRLLIDSGLVQDLYADIGTVYTDDMGYDFFMDLTDYGLRNIQNVLLIILGYLQKIRSNADKLFESYYEETRAIDVMHFNTFSRYHGENIVDAVNDLHNSYSTDLKFIRVFDLLDDRKEIRKHFIRLMDEIVKDINLRMKVIIMSNTFKETDLLKVDPYYQTHYDLRVEQFNPDTLTRFFDMDYLMPELNPYIPNSFKVIVPIETSETFESIRSETMDEIDDPNEFVRLASQNFYHLLKTNKYNTHYAYGSFIVELSSLANDLSPIDALILAFYTSLIREAHQAETFLMTRAGSYFGLRISDRAIRIDFHTFDMEVTKLLQDCLGWYFTEKYHIDENAYVRIYKTFKDSFANFEKAEPYIRLVPTFAEFVNPEDTISNAQLLYAIQAFDPELMKDNKRDICYDNLQSRALALMRKGSVRGIMAGSIRLNTAQNVVKIVDSLFEYEKSFRIRRISNQVLNSKENKLDDTSSNDIYSDADTNTYVEYSHTVQNKNPDDKNIGIMYCIHLGEYVRSEYDPDKYPEMLRNPIGYEIVANMIGQKFFNVMRTENELGYYVRAGTFEITTSGVSNIFLRFEIQTQEKDIVNIVRGYVDTELSEIIDEFDEKNLAKAIATMKDRLFADPSNMGEKFRFAFSVQSDMTYEELENIGETTFLNRLRMVNVLKEANKLSVKYVKDLFHQAIKSNPRYLIRVMPST